MTCVPREVPKKPSPEELGVYSPRELELRRRRSEERRVFTPKFARRAGLAALIASGAVLFAIALDRDNDHARQQTATDILRAGSIILNSQTPASVDDPAFLPQAPSEDERYPSFEEAYIACQLGETTIDTPEGVLPLDCEVAEDIHNLSR